MNRGSKNRHYKARKRKVKKALCDRLIYRAQRRLEWMRTDHFTCPAFLPGEEVRMVDLAGRDYPWFQFINAPFLTMDLVTKDDSFGMAPLRTSVKTAPLVKYGLGPDRIYCYVAEGEEERAQAYAHKELLKMKVQRNLAVFEVRRRLGL